VPVTAFSMRTLPGLLLFILLGTATANALDASLLEGQIRSIAESLGTVGVVSRS
jgi:hypothetical protein